MKVAYEIPVKTSTPGNSRVHWRVAAKAAKLQRLLARVHTIDAGPTLPAHPVTVTLTRISAGTCDRHNLLGNFKHLIDGIADAYGVDDGDDGWTFVARQEKGPRGQHSVRVEIESNGESAE